MPNFTIFSLFKKNIFLSFLILLCVFIRFLWIDRFPVGMTHDDLEYILSGQSYWFLGTDLSGVSFPASIFKTQTEGIISFLPAFLFAPYYGLVDLSQTSVRALSVIVSLVTCIFVILLTKKIFNNDKLSLIVGIIFLINPWSFFLSRYTVESPLSLLFYIVGIYLLLKAKTKLEFIFAFLAFVAGFFSYHAAKFLFLPLIFLTSLYISSFSLKKLQTTHRKFIACAVLFFLLFLFIEKLIPGSIANTRSGDLIINKDFSSVVDIERKLVIDNTLNSIFLNKVTILIKTFAEKYLSVFSPHTLFLSGDLRATYRFEYHGLFFIVDAMLLLVGIFFTFLKHKKEFFWLFSLLLIAPLPTALSAVDTSQINRSINLMPVLIIFISIGIYYLLNLTKGITQKLISLLLIGVLAISFSNFLHFYFLRFPITAQENYFLSERVLAHYLSFNTNSQILVVTEQPRAAFLESVFYFQSKDIDINKNDLLSQVKSRNFKIYNMTFTNICPDQINGTVIVHRNSNCDEFMGEKRAILDQKDGSHIFTIYNDSLCSVVGLDNWRRFHHISDYAIETMKHDAFCKSWIANKVI